MNGYILLGIINLIIYILLGIKGADVDLLEFYVVVAICWMAIGEIKEGFSKVVRLMALKIVGSEETKK